MARVENYGERGEEEVQQLRGVRLVNVILQFRLQFSANKNIGYCLCQDFTSFYIWGNCILQQTEKFQMRFDRVLRQLF